MSVSDGHYIVLEDINSKYIRQPKMIATKLRNYFVYNLVMLVIYNNIIVAHKQRLINYFEVMSRDRHYIVLADIISNK